MSRNQRLHFEAPSGLTPVESRTGGVFSFFNPTRAHLSSGSSSEKRDSPTQSDDHLEKANGALPSNVHYLWRARDNRKGRHAIVIDPDAASDGTTTLPESTAKLKQVVKTVGAMCVKWNYWDVSWIVAVIFTVGSVCWCINGFFAFLPIIRPHTKFTREEDGELWTAWAGATIFEIGSVFLMMEALNESHTACFGWAVKESLEEGTDGQIAPDLDGCQHHHRKGRIMRSKQPTVNAPPSTADQHDNDRPSWVWWPSWYACKTHYFHQLGFWACFFQTAGATIFWIAGFTAIPGVINMNNIRLANGVFWLPQVIGGSGFIISSILLMLETQKKWWKPEPLVLGWHIGFWNLVGGVGFTLCGALGFASANSGAEYESALATFWGSWAFLIGSFLQWYEAMNKYPVETAKKKKSKQ